MAPGGNDRWVAPAGDPTAPSVGRSARPPETAQSARWPSWVPGTMLAFQGGWHCGKWVAPWKVPLMRFGGGTVSGGLHRVECCPETLGPSLLWSMNRDGHFSNRRCHPLRIRWSVLSRSAQSSPSGTAAQFSSANPAGTEPSDNAPELLQADQVTPDHNIGPRRGTAPDPAAAVPTRGVPLHLLSDDDFEPQVRVHHCGSCFHRSAHRVRKKTCRSWWRTA